MHFWYFQNNLFKLLEVKQNKNLVRRCALFREIRILKCWRIPAVRKLGAFNAVPRHVFLQRKEEETSKNVCVCVCVFAPSSMWGKVAIWDFWNSWIVFDIKFFCMVIILCKLIKVFFFKLWYFCLQNLFQKKIVLFQRVQTVRYGTPACCFYLRACMCVYVCVCACVS